MIDMHVHAVNPRLPGVKTLPALLDGMVISIEPGIYLHGDIAGGFRHSDTVLVTRDGCECLTRLPTDIQSLTVTDWKPATWVRGALVRHALRPETTRSGVDRHDGSARPATDDPQGGHLTRRLAALRIDRDDYQAYFRSDPIIDFPREFEALEHEGLVLVTDAAIEPTPLGMFYADSIAGLLVWNQIRSQRGGRAGIGLPQDDVRKNENAYGHM